MYCLSFMMSTEDRPISLRWTNVCYTLKPPKRRRKKRSKDVEKGEEHVESRVILDKVSGSLRRGEMMAILGASGAGKTTLLQILSARIGTSGNLTGEIECFGKPRDPKTWKRTIGFVEQDDTMLPLLTVRETLMFSAKLRLSGKSYTDEAKDNRVGNLIEVLRLSKCQNTKIGTSASRDEPTSGLDAFSAHSVVENLKRISTERQISCLTTIHQPSWALLSLFDRVQLLTLGSVYYEGSVADMVTWFDSLGYRVPEGVNPADYYITIAENPEKSQEGDQRVQKLVNSWSARHVENLTGDKQVDELSQNNLNSRWASAWPSEVTILTHRIAKQMLRDRDSYVGVGLSSLFTLLLVGFAFFRLGRDQNDVLARIGVLFFLVINTSFTVILPVLTPFPLQRAVMTRERSAGVYRSSSFLLSKLLTELPYNVILRLPFSVLFYWMVGLKPNVSSFFIFLGISSLQATNSVCLGLFIGSVSPTVELANVLAPLFTIVFLLFGGNLLPTPPPWFIWLRYISPLTYSYAALAQEEFRHQRFTCSAQATQCYATGEQVLEQYHLQEFSVGQCAGLLVAISCGFIAAAYLGIRFIAHPRFRYC